MIRSSVLSVALAVATTTVTTSPARLVAQQAAPQTEQDPAAVERQIGVLKLHIDAREQRVKEMQDEIIRLDARVERAISSILKTLESVSDTQDSKTKVIRMKQDVIKALATTIEEYQQKRSQLAGELQKAQPDLSVSDVQDGVAVFDKKIEKRVEQILELNRTISSSGNYSRYVDTYRDRGRYIKRSTRENPKFRQAKRTNTQSETTKRAISDALQEGMDRLEKDNTRLREMLNTPGYTEDQKRLIQEEIDRNDHLLAKRYDQFESELLASPVKGSPITLSAAMDLDRLMQDAGNDLQRDFYSIFTNYNQIVVEKKKIQYIHNLITQREAWLKANAPATDTAPAPAEPASESDPEA